MEDGCLYLTIGKTGYLMLDRLGVTTSAIITTTTIIKPSQTTPKTETEHLTLPCKVGLSSFSA